MSQATVWNVPLAGPGTMSQFAGRAGPSLDAILTLHSGAGRPAYAVANTLWLKIVSGTVWELYLFDGTDDILIGTINTGPNSFVVNSGALGFNVSTVARNDVTPLSLVNGRVVLTQEAGGQGQIEIKGINTGNGDQAAIRFSNGVSNAQLIKLLSQHSTSSLRLLNGSDVEVFRFGTDGDIVSSTWGKLSEQITQPGEVVLGPWTSAPPGLVTLNGALLSRTTYARLWSFTQTYGKLVSDATWSAGAYGAFSTGDGSTTFRIPSCNGFFIRGVPHEVDYTIGTYVPDSFASHNHGVNDPSHYHTYNQPVPTAAAALGSLNYTNVPSGTATGYAYTGISIQSAGSGSETKPRNIALRACIKY